MSVSWKDTDSEARKYAYNAAMKSGEFDQTVPAWDIYCDLREALIWALLLTGFPKGSDWTLNENNWREVFKRLSITERITGCYRTYDNGHRKPRKMYFQPEEVKSMIGLSVNAGNKTETEFKNYIWKRLMEGAESELHAYDCIDPSNPYKREAYSEVHEETGQSDTQVAA